ncbi:MAG TPA: DUF1269 domain-containing protein [Streptosporangiaceae bacterium]|nr:DUF1269 domain-containing protein [Streptosporangiaceae bacterium]
MAALTVWKFPSPDRAAIAVCKLEDMQRARLVRVPDAAVVTWEEGKRKPKTQELRGPGKADALGGVLWGLLFGLIFFIPLLGLAIGTATGALIGSMADLGISDAFIREVRAKVTPGSSALFLLSSDAFIDRVAVRLFGTEVELISTNLSGEQEARLREAFSVE